MPDCCIQNCNSRLSNTAYFKFPLQNPELLEKWLEQIGKPNWQPNENSYICATHFCNKNIVSHTHRKYIALKQDAIPTIFPKQMNHILPLITQKSRISAMNNCATIKSSIAILPSMIQSAPLVLTPTIVEPLTTMNSTLLPLSNTPQRFRKILPKLNQNSNAMPIISPERNNISSNTPLNSYILIIPTFDGTDSISAPNNQPKLPSPNKIKSILRITINRKYDIDPSLVKFDNINSIGDDDSRTRSDWTFEENSGENGNDMIEEVVINHETSEKLVVFSLNTVTGKISVSYRDNSSVAGRNAKLPGTHMKLRENPRKRKIWEEPGELGNIYKKVKKDCSTLRSRLQILRKKHKKEKDAIETLQRTLAAIGTNKEMTLTTEKLIDESNGVKIESKHIMNESKLPRDENKSNYDRTCVAGSIQMEIEPFIWTANEENGHCDLIAIDDATVTVQTSDLKTFH